MWFAIAAVLPLLTSHGLAQKIGGAPATSANVAPAVAIVPAPAAKKESALFNWETQQLTQAILTNLTNLKLDNISLFNFGTGTTPSKPAAGFCKAFPGEARYPGPIAWAVLDLLTSGAVIKTVPLAAPCYQNWPQYDPAKCAQISAQWSDPHLHVNDPSSTQWPLYEGMTCLPPGQRNATGSNMCTLGGYASYSLKVTNVAQIQLALNFARLTNIRLVVKNTGHDFADKSVGAGALSLWTHPLQDLKFIKNYSYGTYQGPAFKIAAGVVTEAIYAAAEQNDVTVAGGECHTVGLAGGYTAGGGHSVISSLVGMAADQILSLEVVLPDGTFVTASATQNPDLYYALRGGGGSTFGVVTSIIVRAYPKIPVTTMTFSYSVGPNLNDTTFWAGFRAFMTYFNTFIDAGAYSYFLVAGAPGSYFFQFMPFWGGNMTKPRFQTLVNPYLADLARLGIQVTPNITEFPSVYTAYNANFGAEQVGASNNHAGSRLFPRENFQGAKIDTTLAAVRYAIDKGNALIGYNIRAAPNPTVNQTNAVNPAWRKAASHFIMGSGWDPNTPLATIAEYHKNMTTDWLQKWRDVSPGAGAYMSEGDINEPNFQQAFFGTDNYKYLYTLKQLYDPTGLFYAPQAVGSEDWYITDQIPYLPTQNGKLCKK